MPDTSFFFSELNMDRIAIPYGWSGSAYVSYGHQGVAYYPSTTLKSSSQQLGRFFGALLNHGEFGGASILDSTSVAQITTPQYSTPSASIGLLLFRFNLGGRTIWWHDGWWLGVGTCASFCPDEGTGVIVLTNTDPTPCLQQVTDAIYDFAQTQTAVAASTPPVSLSFELGPAYPNPIATSAHLSYRLQVPGPVDVSVFDVGGRKVAELDHGWRAAGAYDVVFDGAQFGAGVYFARLRVGSLEQTRKLLLVR
jgi:hypothetical protein